MSIYLVISPKSPLLCLGYELHPSDKRLSVNSQCARLVPDKQAILAPAYIDVRSAS